MSATLHDKLQRLRTKEGAGPARVDAEAPQRTEALERLERTLIGGVAEDLPLKARLERLVAVASAQRPRVEPASDRHVPLEEAVQGVRRENARGEFFLVEHDVHVDTLHGAVSMSRFHQRRDDDVAVLTGDPGFAGFDLRRAVFLDTETTGLAGGTGTAAFLIGLGYLDGDRFRVRQYFMRDYHEEPALLAGLAEDLKRFDRIVTFNGKMFDVPLLETRYRLARSAWPLDGVPHLDLLHPARRLWKLRLDSCRLTSLESALLGVRRRGDVPGHEIPWIYFEYVRNRNARAIQGVLDHNRLDIVSLAALSLFACEWVREGRAADPRDAYSLARVFDRAGHHGRAIEHYRAVAEHGEGAPRIAALVRLARSARAAGDHAAAVRFWCEAAEAGEPLGFKALAVHYERRARDFAAALEMVERGLRVVEDRFDGRSRRLEEDFLRRRARLRKTVVPGG